MIDDAASAVSGRRVVDQFGDPYLMKVFSSWGMSQNLTNAEITEALEAVAERGFNAVNVAFVAVGRYQPSPPGGPFNLGGQVFALFVIAIAAAEVGVGLAIVLLIYRNRVGVNLDEIDLMKG